MSDKHDQICGMCDGAIRAIEACNQCDYTEIVYGVLVYLTGTQSLKIGLRCVLDALPIFESYSQIDPRPRAATQLVERYLAGIPVALREAEAALADANSSARELDDGSYLYGTNIAAYCALCVGDAAANLVLGLGDQIKIDTNNADPITTNVHLCTAYTMTMSADAHAADVRAAQLRQIGIIHKVSQV